MKYIIFNWKSYLNLTETLKLSNLVNKLPNTKNINLFIVQISYLPL